jgi:hypothetical protein
VSGESAVRHEGLIKRAAVKLRRMEAEKKEKEEGDGDERDASVDRGTP